MCVSLSSPILRRKSRRAFQVRYSNPKMLWTCNDTNSIHRYILECAVTRCRCRSTIDWAFPECCQHGLRLVGLDADVVQSHTERAVFLHELFSVFREQEPIRFHEQKAFHLNGACWSLVRDWKEVKRGPGMVYFWYLGPIVEVSLGSSEAFAEKLAL